MKYILNLISLLLLTIAIFIFFSKNNVISVLGPSSELEELVLTPSMIRQYYTQNPQTAYGNLGNDTTPQYVPSTQVNSQAEHISSDFRAFWVATIYNLDYPSAATTDELLLKSQALEILDFASYNGYNAVILQVRPSADSFFNSQYFPWSKFLTGEQGVAPQNNFDPLTFWTAEAHKRGLELHAWLNPYRITKNDTGTSSTTLDSLASSHPARLHPDWVVQYTDGNLYFDPGIPEVRSLIVESVAEIVQNYGIDGIHFDDYFYPGQNFDDSKTVQKYGSAYPTADDFRRASVDELIRNVQTTIKSIKQNCRFGVSPFGIWANIASNPLGSQTNGTESYYDHFADSRKWVKEGWIDYIAPQLYWDIGNANADYQALLNWWIDVVKGTEVELYIGQAAYRAGNMDIANPWFGTNEIIAQLTLNQASIDVSGSIFFRYSFLKSNLELNRDISAFFSEMGEKLPVNGLPASTSNTSTIANPSNSQTVPSITTTTAPTSKPTVASTTTAPTSKPIIASTTTIAPTIGQTIAQPSETKIPSYNPASVGAVGIDFSVSRETLTELAVLRPSADISTTYDSFYIAGSSDPQYPLYVNGQEVVGRSSIGFFGVLFALNDGENVINFSQNGKTVTRIITKAVTAAKVVEMTDISIASSSTFPQSQEYRQIGEKIVLKCSAPAGSSVSVELDGKTYTMSSTTTARTDGKIVATTFTYSYTIPAVDGTAEIINLGNPKYTAVWNGKTYTAVAPAKVGVILKNTSIYATIKKDIADTYRTASSANGCDNYLYKDMRCAITGMTGEYVRLSQSCWIKKHNVTISELKKPVYPVISSPTYTIGDSYDTLSFKSSEATSAIASFDGELLTVKISPALSASPMALPQNGFFTSVSNESGSGYEKYIFGINSGMKFDGYYLEQTKDGFILYLKHRPKVSAGNAPLNGITILLDAGHGGNDSGALGCLGSIIPEKSINLATAFKLETQLKNLGATVLMTRTSDTAISLQERQEISFQSKPDLFLSIHANSLNDDMDISKVSGYSVFYKSMVGKGFGSLLFNKLGADLGLANRGVHQSNLYVARGSWTPSVILESGFMPNPSDFQWMIDNNSSSQLAKTLANCVLQYFY